MPARQAHVPRERATGSRELRARRRGGVLGEARRSTSCPVSPCRALGRRRAAQPSRAVLPRQPRPRGDGCTEGSSFHVDGRNRSFDTRDRGAARRVEIREAVSRPGKQLKSRRCFFGGAARRSPRGCDRSWIATTSSRASEARSPQTPECGGARRARLDGRVVYSLARSMEWESRRGRCVGVNAACDRGVWARDPDVCRAGALLLRKEAEISCASTRCGGLRASAGPLMRRPGARLRFQAVPRGRTSVTSLASH